MQIDDEVRAALDTLRRHAGDNAFEQHRIDVLERDLTAPPIAEQVDETHQLFDGRLYYLLPRSGHYQATIGIHQAVWMYYFGAIPAGMDIHHFDVNPANNAICNLDMETRAEHMKRHMADKPARIVEKTCAVCGKKFMAPAWRKSECCSRVCGLKLGWMRGSRKRRTPTMKQ